MADSSSNAVQRELLTVFGSVNADIYIEIDRLPKKGETIQGKDDSGFMLPGGKGANQAVACANLAAACTLVCNFGNDDHARKLEKIIEERKVEIGLCKRVDKPSGQAYILLQDDGDNSIIIVGAANMMWGKELTDDHKKAIKGAQVVLLQREVPEHVNQMVASYASECKVPVILDAGGRTTPIDDSLFAHLHVFAPNETELARVTGLPVNNEDEVIAAAKAVIDKGANHVLVHLGARGSILVSSGSGGKVTTLAQPALKPTAIVDTTGAGDAYTAAFGVALAEKKSMKDAMLFATAAATLAITVKGAMPSMPERNAVDVLVAKAKNGQL